MKSLFFAVIICFLMVSPAFAAPKKTLLKVYATWCGPCKSLSKMIETPEVQAELKNYNFLEVDSDKNAALCKKYNVDSLPTMIIVNSNRDVLDRKVGLMSKNELAEWLKRNK